MLASLMQWPLIYFIGLKIAVSSTTNKTSATLVPRPLFFYVQLYDRESLAYFLSENSWSFSVDAR